VVCDQWSNYRHLNTINNNNFKKIITIIILFYLNINCIIDSYKNMVAILVEISSLKMKLIKSEL